MNPIEPIRPEAIERVQPHRRVAERPRDEEEREQRRRQQQRREPEPEDDAPADDGLPHVDVRI